MSRFREIERFARGEMSAEGDRLNERGGGDDAEEWDESVLGEQAECWSECEVGIYETRQSKFRRKESTTYCLCCRP